MNIATVETLLPAARRSLAQGDAATAARIYSEVLRLAPNHVEALNATALSMLHAGDLLGARTNIERALVADPQHLLSRIHLAQLLEAEGDRNAARLVYRQVLERRPGLYAARLALARLVEEGAGVSAAAPLYFKALSDAQRDGRWTGSATTPIGIRDQVEHAIRVVEAERAQLFGGVLDELLSRFGRPAMQRISLALDVYLGRAHYNSGGTTQAPSFLPVPGLPLRRFLDPRDFPELGDLEAQTPVILAELEALLPALGVGEKVFHDKELERRHLRGDSRQPGWSGQYFYRYGQRRAVLHAQCPGTSRALERLPLCRVRGHAPEVLFSVMAPGTHLLPHVGITNSRVVGHLGLIVPNNCGLRVDGETYHWTRGEAVVFDDTFPHEAWNRSDQNRIVLIFDLWHPDLSAEERIAIAQLVEAIGDFREGADEQFFAHS